MLPDASPFAEMDLSIGSSDNRIAERFSARGDAVDENNDTAIADNHATAAGVSNGLIVEKAGNPAWLGGGKIKRIIHCMRAVV